MCVFREMSDAQRASARHKLRDGADGFLKVSLVALLPRLVNVKIVSAPSEEALSWLANALQWGRQGPSWTPWIRRSAPWRP